MKRPSTAARPSLASLASIGAPVVLVGALLAAAVAAASFATTGFGVAETGWQPPPAEPSPPPPPPPPPPEFLDAAAADTSTGWLAHLLTGLAVAVVAVLAGLLLWVVVRRLRLLQLRPDWLRLRGLRGSGPGVVTAGAMPPPPAEEELLAAVTEAVARSEAGDDPRRAVISCWVRLTESAAEAGVDRYPSDTAADLVLRLLRGYRVSESVLVDFAAAYRRARYATHPVDEGMREQARSALERVRAELQAAAPVPAQPEPEVPR